MGGSLNPQHGEATSVPVSFQMENILLDERGKSLVALPWGHPICGDTLSMGTRFPCGIWPYRAPQAH